MRFVLVNGRTPCSQSFCAWCCDPSPEAFLAGNFPACSRRPLAQLAALHSHPLRRTMRSPRSGDRMRGEIVRHLFSTPPAVR
jgi:hypothetical protein